MPKFKVVIPEDRKEYVLVEYEIEAPSEAEVKRLIADGTFFDEAEYMDTDSPWGFEVENTYDSKAEISEVTSG
jgi:hypothetical protein